MSYSKLKKHEKTFTSAKKVKLDSLNENKLKQLDEATTANYSKERLEEEETKYPRFNEDTKEEIIS